MTGKTHISVGLASSLLVTQPDTIKEMVLCTGIAFIGSVISDVDVDTSESHRDLVRVISIIAIAACMIAFADYRWGVGIVDALRRHSGAVRLATGIGAFLGICIFGMFQPHRSFMHSLPGMALLCGSLWYLYPTMVPYFVVSMASHIIIDMLNYKKVRILYPLKGGIGLDFCLADGLVNNLLFTAGSITAAVFFFIQVVRMF